MPQKYAPSITKRLKRYELQVNKYELYVTKGGVREARGASSLLALASSVLLSNTQFYSELLSPTQ